VLSFFTDPYKDEILYSTIARYHYYYGNVDFKDTLTEIFGSDSVIPTIAFPTKLEYLSSQFPNSRLYNSDYLIQNHTLYPYYSPFLPAQRQVMITNEMKSGDGKGIYAQIGSTDGSVSRKHGLYYCPLCVAEDKEKYGEPYFRRVHQLQGIEVCPEHNCMLRLYPVSQKNESRLAFLMLEYKNADLCLEYIIDNRDAELYNMVSDSASYLINNDLKSYNQHSVYEKYRIILKNKGFMTYNGTIRQRQLHEEFLDFYGERFLHNINSEVVFEDTYNWLRIITQKPEKVIHPVRHILFINFLTESIRGFFEAEYDLVNPFGKGPWPCMNPVSDHFRKDVVSECVITADFKTRQPVGTFSCSCGFVYSRKGPDRIKDDKYKVGRIKQFGHVWENKLKELLLENRYSIRQLGNKMDCESKTILRYSRKLGMDNLLKSNAKLEEDAKEARVDNSFQTGEQYKTDILEYIRNNPDKNRKEVRNNFKKQYAWLYRNDRVWIDNNFPEKIPFKERNKGYTNPVDWKQRDIELLKEIEIEYAKLIAQDKPIRITKSLLGKRTGKSAALDINIDKLPETKAYIENVIESVEDFQIRRVRKICEELYEIKGSLKEWEAIRKAGLRPGYSKNVDDAIDDFINIICEGKNEGKKG
jgi:hypothetical protein